MAEQTYVAVFRWRDGNNVLNETFKEFGATSLAAAKKVAKALEGRGDDMRWFDRVFKKEAQ